MRVRRSSTVGFVLSTTTEDPAPSAASINCACLLFRFLLLGKRSLLTSSCVAANRSRKNVLFPEACKPMKITSSNTGFDPSDGTTTIISGEGRNGSIVWPRGRDGRIRAVDLYSRIYDRENELIRASMVHLLSGVVPLYVVNEFPKSGGTWVGQMLGHALGVPFPRNRFPVFRSSIMHGHYLKGWGMRNVVVSWRDGRDIMVSWYHQQLIPHEYNQQQVARSRRELRLEDYDDVYGNLPAFIHYAFTRPHSPNFSWTDFVRRWRLRKGVVHVRYEDLRRSTAEELRRIVSQL